MDFDPEEFGRRLRRELAERGWDVKQLHETIRQKYGNLRGSSYGSVWSYVKGQAPSEPRRELIEACAALFDVRPEYLLAGGPRTEAEEALRQSGQNGDWLVEEIRAAIPDLDDLDYVVAVALLTHLHRWVKAHLRAGYEVEPDAIVEYGRSVWEYLMEPFTAWGKRLGLDTLDLNPRGVSDYAMAMLHGLNFALEIAAPARSTEKEDEADG